MTLHIHRDNSYNTSHQQVMSETLPTKGGHSRITPVRVFRYNSTGVDYMHAHISLHAYICIYVHRVHMHMHT